MDLRPVAGESTYYHPAFQPAVGGASSWRAVSLSYPDAPVSHLLEEAAHRYPERAACTLYGKATSFMQLSAQAHRLAQSLAELGARPGRYVGVLLPNIPDYLLTMQATWLTGATVLQFSPLMVAEEIGHWLKATGCHIMVTLDLLAPVVMGALERGPLEHVIVASLANRVALWRRWLYHIERLRRNGSLYLREDAHRHRLDHLLEATPFAKKVPLRPEEDVAVLAPTGGTTASPKAVLLTHRNLVSNALQLRCCCEAEDGTESTLGVLPFFHSYGLSVCVLTSWATASTIHLYPRYETRAVLSLIHRHRITLMPAVPAMLHALNGRLKRRPRDLSFIRAVISGAAALTSDVRTAFEKWGVKNIVEGYGLTEASPVTHANPLGAANRPGTIGLPLPDTEARIVDAATGERDLPDGEAGELIIRGPQVMKGYFQNSEATALALRNGWLYTGDLARRDRDGYYSIIDRKKDIIKTSGFLVFPAEVEEILCSHPEVREAAVVAVPDHERGELIKAFVVPRNSGGKKMDLTALESYCQQHLGKQKRPRQIEVVQELPKNFLGKVLRRRLRESSLATEP